VRRSDVYRCRQLELVPLPLLKLLLAGSQAMSPAAATTGYPPTGEEDGEGLGGGGDVLGRGEVLGDGDGVPLSAVTRSCGRFADSRLARLVAVTLVDVSAKLTGSFPEMSGVTSHSSHDPAEIGPYESVIDRTPGMLLYVSVVSPQLLVATPRTLMLSEFALLAKTRSLALVTGEPSPSGSKRRKLRTSGEPSVRICVDVPKFVPGSALLTNVSATGTKVELIGAPEADGTGELVSWTSRTSTAGKVANTRNVLSFLTGPLNWIAGAYVEIRTTLSHFRRKGKA
jgi:hypothetical protein